MLFVRGRANGRRGRRLARSGLAHVRKVRLERHNARVLDAGLVHRVQSRRALHEPRFLVHHRAI